MNVERYIMRYFSINMTQNCLLTIISKTNKLNKHAKKVAINHLSWYSNSLTTNQLYIYFSFCSAKNIYYINRIVPVVLKIHRNRCESSFSRILTEKELETQYSVTRIHPHLPPPNYRILPSDWRTIG